MPLAGRGPGAPYKAACVAAKHAVLGLAKVTALEGAAAGLTANAVAPGWMRTPLADDQIRDHMRLRGISPDERPQGFFVPVELLVLIRDPGEIAYSATRAGAE